MLRLAELRNRELTFGISDDQVVTLFGVLDTLLGRAIALFEQERKFVALNQGQGPVDFQDLVDEGLPDNGVAVDRSRVLPPFITLSSYMLRGGALAHKRRTGLSNFELGAYRSLPQPADQLGSARPRSLSGPESGRADGQSPHRAEHGRARRG